MDKKSRSKNYTERDKSLLIDLVAEYKDVIENKKIDGATTAEKKAAWDEIALKYNSVSGMQRSGLQLKCFYKQLKHRTRKNIHAEEVSYYNKMCW